MMEWTVTSSLLILVIVGLRGILKGKISLRLQYGLWLLVLVRLLVPFSFGSTQVSVMNAVEPVETRLTQAFQAPAAPVLVPAAEPEAVTVPQTPRPESGKVPVDWRKTAEWVWLGGMGVLALWLLGSDLHFAFRLRRTRRRLATRDYPVRLFSTEAVESPCLFGLFRPAVYVTPEVLEDKGALWCVLEHERTHYRHGDHIWSLLRGLCLVVHWYNPLVWLAAVLSKRDSELACDESTVRAMGEQHRMGYGRTLIHMTCKKNELKHIFSTATTMNCGKRTLKERIKLLQKHPKTAVITLIAVLLIAAVAVSCTFTGAKAEEQPPEPKTETPEPVEDEDLPILGYGVNTTEKNISIDLPQKGKSGVLSLEQELAGLSWKELNAFEYAFRIVDWNDGDLVACFLPTDPACIQWTEDLETWQRVELTEINGKAVSASKMGVYSETGGWLWVQGELAGGKAEHFFYTTEDGKVWEDKTAYLPSNPRPLDNLCFVYPGVGFLTLGAGYNGPCPALYRTTDGGLSWTECAMETELEKGYLHMAWIEETGEGLTMECEVIGDETRKTCTLYSIDRGKLWTTEAPGTAAPETELQAIQERLLTAENPDGVGEDILDAFAQWIVSSDGQWFRQNFGGAECTWRVETRDTGLVVLLARGPLVDGFGDSQCVDYEEGQVTLGPSGTWQEEIVTNPVRSHKPLFLRAQKQPMEISDGTNTFLCDASAIVGTVQDGIPWTYRAEYVSGAMLGETAWIYLPTDDGVLLQTTDGGKSWEEKPVGIPVEDTTHSDLGFLNDQIGWLLLEDGNMGMTAIRNKRLYVTQDGGDTWSGGKLTELEPYQTEYLTFVSETEGFLSLHQTEPLENGDLFSKTYLYHTTDSGRTWDLCTLPEVEAMDNLNVLDISVFDGTFQMTCSGIFSVPSHQRILHFTSEDGAVWTEVG